jgi:hypothetical protein
MSNKPDSIVRPSPVAQKKSEFSITSAHNRHEIVVPHTEDSFYYREKSSDSDSISEEQIEHVPEGTASSGKALFMLLKAFIGTGVIFLPGS